MTAITAQLARFTSELTWDAAPGPVRAAAETSLRDCLAVALAGSVEPEFGKLRAIEAPAQLEAGRLADATSAATLLGTAAHILDYDDIHLAMGGHPSAVVIGAVLAAGAARRADPPEILAGFLAGLESAARIGRAISAGHYHVGWHPTSVIGALAAAIGAARVMNLDQERTQRALGLAAAMSSGTKANFGTMSKPLQVGLASRAGVLAAAYADAGLTANETILDQQHGGFTRLFTESVDEQAFLDDLGTDFSITRPAPVIKLIPACGGVHAATWAAIDLAETHDLEPDAIARVKVEVHPKRIPHTNRPTVTTGLEGKFSTQYCVAVGMTQRRVTLADFTAEAIFERDRQALMSRTALMAAPDADEWPGSSEYSTGARGARVTADLVDGTEVQAFLGAAPGYPGNAATAEQLRAKFLDCAGRAATADEAERWHGALHGGEESAVAAVREIVRRVVVG